jgi:hypothetical protein
VHHICDGWPEAVFLAAWAHFSFSSGRHRSARRVDRGCKCDRHNTSNSGKPFSGPRKSRKTRKNSESKKTIFLTSRHQENLFIVHGRHGRHGKVQNRKNRNSCLCFPSVLSVFSVDNKPLNYFCHVRILWSISSFVTT